MVNINKFIKRTISLTLAVYFMMNSSVFSADVVFSDEYTISDGVTFKRENLVDKDLNRHKGFVVEYDPNADFSSMEFLFGTNLNTRNTVTKLLEMSTDKEGNAVAAMNGDFFNMSTGLAESVVIKDGILLTSDRDNFALSFDSEGKAFIDKPAIEIEMETANKQYKVLHFNKEFTQYGLYLYSPHYGEKTRIDVPSVELVLMPYEECYDYEYFALLLYGNEELPEDFWVQESIVTHEEEYQASDGNEIIESEFENFADNTETNIVDDKDVQATESSSYSFSEKVVEHTLRVNEKYRLNICEYAKELGYIQVGESFYKKALPEARLGKTINTVVVGVRNNKEGNSLDIPREYFVLSANENTQSFKFENIDTGDGITLTFNCNEKFVDVKEAIGCGALIVNNGEVVEHSSQSHYLSANPRTAVGITESGKVVMFACDGRQGTYSKGLTLKELSEEMIRLGCKYAANLDGGGSTVVKALLPGDEKIETVNSPSDKSERKVSNAIAFYNLALPDGSKTYSYLNSPSKLVLSNSFLELGQAFYTDKAHYPSGQSQIREQETDEFSYIQDEILRELINISSEYEDENTAENNTQSGQGENITYDYDGFTYSVDENTGVVQDGYYKPMGYAGDVYVISNSPEGHQNIAVKFKSLSEVDDIILDGVKLSVYEGDSFDLSAKALYFGYDVTGSDDCFVWESTSEAVNVDSEGVVNAVKSADKANITVSFGNTAKTLEFEIKQLPFADISSNWAKNTIITLFEKGISNGEITENGRMYFPSRNFTRNEFCVMLSRLLKLTSAIDSRQVDNESGETEALNETETENEIQGDTESELETASLPYEEATSQLLIDSEQENQAHQVVTLPYVDADAIPDWAKDAVLQLYNNEYLDGFEHSDESGMYFHGSQYVTRREVIRLVGRLFDNTPQEYQLVFTDISEDDSDLDSIKNVVFNGIFNGYLDGTLKIDSFLTRAEVSAVFVRLSEYLSE